jgi:hypothetical protein
MGSFTDYAEKKILDHVLKVASYSPPGTVYLGLSTADPTDDASGWANPTYTGYARKAITFAAAGSRSIVQTGAVTFDPCTAGSSVVTHWGIWDQLATGGNLLAHGVFAAPKTIQVGNTPSVATAEVAVSFNAGAIFTPFAEAILDWLFRAQTLAQPSNVKVGLSTTTPTDGGPTITEPSGNNYAQVTFNTWNAGAGPSPMLCDNDGTINFPTPSGSWGLCTHAVVYGDTTPMFYLDTPDNTPGNGDTVSFATGTLDITLD